MCVCVCVWNLIQSLQVVVLCQRHSFVIVSHLAFSIIVFCFFLCLVWWVSWEFADATFTDYINACHGNLWCTFLCHWSGCLYSVCCWIKLTTETADFETNSVALHASTRFFSECIHPDTHKHTLSLSLSTPLLKTTTSTHCCHFTTTTGDSNNAPSVDTVCLIGICLK